MKPLTLSAHEVRAVLDGTKTQHWAVLNARGQHVLRGLYETVGNNLVPIPKYSPGDQIWVREAWRSTPMLDDRRPSRIPSGYMPIEYEAGPLYLSRAMGKLRQANHMPRWASRITLDVTGVRVCRVQDVTDADAIATGCRPFFDHDNPVSVASPNGGSIPMADLRGPIDDFRRNWIARHGLASWDANDWCEVIDFERRG